MTEREIIYGRNAVAENLKNMRPENQIYKLFVAEGVETKKGGPIDLILAAAKERRPVVPVQQVSRQELDRMTERANHQGVAAEVSPYQYADFDALLADSSEQPDVLFLVLDYLQDPQNLGTLIRSAEATGVTALVIPDRRAASVTPAVRNASSGAVEHLAIAQVVNLPRTLEDMKQLGIWVAGLEDEPNAQLYDQADFSGRLALVVGAEGSGLGRLVREKCDYFVKLPMLGKIASLNAAVAGSIALYEILRQRHNSAPKP